MRMFGTKSKDPFLKLRPVFVDQRNMPRRIEIVAVARDPIQQVLGPEREPFLVEVGICQLGLTKQQQLDFAQVLPLDLGLVGHDRL